MHVVQYLLRFSYAFVSVSFLSPSMGGTVSWTSLKGKLFSLIGLN